MQNESTVESSQYSFLHCFCFAFSDHLPLIVTIVSYLMAAKTGLTVQRVQAHSGAPSDLGLHCLQRVKIFKI
jgi:hypothetical protein